MSEASSKSIGNVGILWRGDPNAPLPPEAEQNRLRAVFDALAGLGLSAEPIIYTEEIAGELLERLRSLDALLVWVDPLDDGRDRSRLDHLLREVASAGVWVSAHPDVILKMGTKDVLFRTKSMSWGTDCYLYQSIDELKAQLTERLAAGPRVLKQHRGNGGNGIWKLEFLPSTAAESPRFQLLHASRGSSLESLDFAALIERFRPYFASGGCVIDQPYQDRLADGMVRCYLVRNRVAGFGHQFVTALLPPPPGSIQSPLPPPRLYYGPSKLEFQTLKRTLETQWIPEMQRLLDIELDTLPVIWDADFLYGPKDPSGQDTYVLCEINVSSVLPFPDEALAPLAAAVADRLMRR